MYCVGIRASDPQPVIPSVAATPEDRHGGNETRPPARRRACRLAGPGWIQSHGLPRLLTRGDGQPHHQRLTSQHERARTQTQTEAVSGMLRMQPSYWLIMLADNNITFFFLSMTDLCENSPALWTFVVEFLFHPATKKVQCGKLGR